MDNLARKQPVGYREQEHANEPSFGLCYFPEAVIRAVKAEAGLGGRTITEVLADELEAVANRLESDPSSRAPYPDDFGDLRSCWSVKHFPKSLRDRLKVIARHEEPPETDRGTPLYRLVARELWTSLGVSNG